MAGQTQPSEVFVSLGAGALDRMTQAHQNDKADRGQEYLPPGINNGVARLRKCEFGTYGSETKNPGKPYFYADAVVVHPIGFVDKAGVKHHVAGKYTKIFISLFEITGAFPKSSDQQWGAMLNELRILNNDHLPDMRKGITESMSPQQKDAVIDANIRSFMKSLTAAQPFLKFRTYVIDKDQPREDKSSGNWYLGKRRGPYPSMEALEAANPYWKNDPLVIHEWQGSTAWEVPNPNGEAAPSAGIGRGPAPAAAPSAPSASPLPSPAGQQPVKVEPPPSFDDGAESLDDLAARCESDISARPLLLARLKAVGGTREEFDGANSWQAIADLIKSRQSAPAPSNEERGEGESEEEGEGQEEGEGEPESSKEWKPEKGRVYPFHPLGANKKPLQKRVNGTVVTVNNTTKTVTLKGDDNKRYPEVKWERLIRE